MKPFFAAAIFAFLPVAALADGPVVGPGSEPFTTAKTLQPGETWISPYTVDASDPFQLDMSFIGTGLRTDLALVRYGIDVATQGFDVINPGRVTAASGDIIGAVIGSSFSIVYTLDAAATRAVSVSYAGWPAPITDVPEIGSEGAAVALLVVLGGLAIATGTRRRETV